jgi:hypothetical protein
VWGSFVAGEAREPLLVEMRPGWGTEAIVVDERGEPLEGARVSFDGMLAGETDAGGRLRAALDRVPSSVRVEYRDWAPTEESGFTLDSGRFRTWEPWVRAVMKPPDG